MPAGPNYTEVPMEMPSDEKVAAFLAKQAKREAFDAAQLRMYYAALGETCAGLSEILADGEPDDEFAAVIQHLGSSLRHLAEVVRRAGIEARSKEGSK